MSKRQAENVLRYIHHLVSGAASGPEQDRQLLERFSLKREEAAFAALLDRYGPMVFGVCRRILHDAHEAEDAFQATFLILARKAETIRQHRSVASWLYQVAYRVAVRARAGAARREDLAARAPLRSAVDPLAEVSGRELLSVLDDELQRLPEKYRAPLLLCYLEGQTQDEAARQLGWSPATLRGRIDRGRAVLRRRLIRRGFGLTAALMGPMIVQAQSPAAVPPLLMAHTLRAAVTPFLDAAMVSAKVFELVELGATTLGAAKLKLVVLMALMLAVLAAGLGAGFTSLRMTDPHTPPSTPAASAPPPQAKDEPRRDGDGEPLPAGAIARLGTRRFRAGGGIDALAFSSDGKTLVASSDREVFLFDVATGKRTKTISPAESASPGEHTVAFSPDGKRLAVATRKYGDVPQKCVVQVWEWNNGRKLLEIDAVPLVWLGWSPEGEPLAVFMEEGALRLRELVSGRSRRFECKELPNISQVRFMVCTCAPSRTLAIADYQPVVHVWDTTSGQKRCTLRPKGKPIALALSPDGLTLASVSDEVAQLWDATTGKLRHTFVTANKWPVEWDGLQRSNAIFSPDGKTLATINPDNIVRFWDVATGRARGHTRSDSRFSSRIAFSPDSKMLATAEAPFGSAVHLWNVPDGTRRPEPAGNSAWPRGIAFSPDGQRVATHEVELGSIRVWNPATGAQFMRIHRPLENPMGCTFSADGRWLFSSWKDGVLRVFDSVNGQERQSIRLIDPEQKDTALMPAPLQLHLSSDGKTLVCLSGTYTLPLRTLVSAWDIATLKKLIERRKANWVAGFIVSPDTRLLAAPRQERPGDPPNSWGRGSMFLEDLESGERLLIFPSVKGLTLPLAFSPDGRLLASCTNYEKGSTLRIWEIASAGEALSLPIAGPLAPAFSPNGRLLALITPEQQILLWDLTQGRELRRFKEMDARPLYLAFSPDGCQLVSALSDTTLLVWDVGTRKTAPRKLVAEDIAKAWADLASSDAPRAFRARWTLASVPDDAIPFLKEHLHPAKSADPQRLRRLMSDLDSEQFALREKAQEELRNLGDLAEPTLRQMLANKPSLEMRQRVQGLLERLHGPVTQPELLQALRAVAVLEDIGTPEAGRLLQELTKGAPESRLTREAKESLRRLDFRRAEPRP